MLAHFSLSFTRADVLARSVALTENMYFLKFLGFSTTELLSTTARGKGLGILKHASCSENPSAE